MSIEALRTAHANSTQEHWDSSGETQVEIMGADDFPEATICRCIGGIAAYEDRDKEMVANATFIALAHDMTPDLIRLYDAVDAVIDSDGDLISMDMSEVVNAMRNLKEARNEQN